MRLTWISCCAARAIEATVIRWVVFPHEVEGYVTGPVPAGTPPPVYTIAPTMLKEAHDQCVAQRKQAMRLNSRSKESSRFPGRAIRV
jgi:hypothetical protein